eukprot:365455-Chlamydomonas_euryale.AAC.30
MPHSQLFVRVCVCRAPAFLGLDSDSGGPVLAEQRVFMSGLSDEAGASQSGALRITPSLGHSFNPSLHHSTRKETLVDGPAIRYTRLAVGALQPATGQGCDKVHAAGLEVQGGRRQGHRSLVV